MSSNVNRQDTFNETSPSTTKATQASSSAVSTSTTKNLPSNLRPDHGKPKYTPPIAPKPENKEQELILEKEVLLSIVAMPDESWEERETRVDGRRRSLEVAVEARWGRNLRDLDILDAERQYWKEYEEAKARGEEV